MTDMPRVDLVPVDVLTPVALDTLQCLCAAFEAAGRPVCRCALFHGQVPPPMDDCDCECAPGVHGQAWVRIVQVVPASGSPGMCGAGLVGASLVLEVGVYRCVVSPDDRGIPPSGDEQTADALAAYLDAAILRHVLACCEPLQDRGVTLGGWEPMGPLGGCAGSRWVAEIQL